MHSLIFFDAPIFTSGELQRLKAYSERLLDRTLGYALLLLGLGILNLKLYFHLL